MPHRLLLPHQTYERKHDEAMGEIFNDVFTINECLDRRIKRTSDGITLLVVCGVSTIVLVMGIITGFA